MSKDSISTLEGAVAHFVWSFKASDIDEEARRALVMLIKDQIAIQAGASQLPWSKQVRIFRAPRPGRATIIGEGASFHPADAAYLNATYGHGFEYDDFAGTAHPGCCVVPTALAVGEEVGATLEQVVAAMVAGYEAYVRIGKLGNPDFLLAGWQPHSVLSNFGAAAIAAKLYDLTEEQTLHALAIALSHAGGPTEYASTGGSIKRVHAGISVRNGIESAALAKAGITGPRRFLTGSRGLYKTFIRKDIGGEAAVEFSSDKPLHITNLSFKAYCCCALTHAYIETMAPLRSRAGEIESVEANIQTFADGIVGNKNENLYGPTNIEELQYSLPTQMALSALGKGNGYKTHRSFLEGELDLSPDSEVIQLARRIKLKTDPELDRKYSHFVADVDVRFKDGTSTHIFQERATGSPGRPFTPEAFEGKLEELTDEVIGNDKAFRFFEDLDRFDLSRPVRDLMAHLQPSAH